MVKMQVVLSAIQAMEQSQLAIEMQRSSSESAFGNLQMEVNTMEKVQKTKWKARDG